MIIDNNNIYDLVPSQIVQIISKVAHFEKHKHNCPYCNGTNFIKYGHDNGVQNYICKECSRKFNDLTGTVFAGTRLTYEQIDTFINCFNDKVSIRKTAKRMKVNKNTVYLLRQKCLIL